MLQTVPRAVGVESRLVRERTVEKIFRSATQVAAVLVLLLLGGVTVSLIHGGWPALAHFKRFVVSTVSASSGSSSHMMCVRPSDSKEPLGAKKRTYTSEMAMQVKT